MKDRTLPDLALKVVLSGLLETAWGSLRRSAVVRFFVYGNNVKIGVGEGNIHQWEIDALREAPIEHEWFKIMDLKIISVPGIKYVPGTKALGMPRELVPVKNSETWIYVSKVEHTIFPVHRSFDINFGGGRMISIISPRTLIKEVVETVHPAFPKERVRGKINNVEVDAKVVECFLKEGYGIGVLKKKRFIKNGEQMMGFPVLGKNDLKIIFECVNPF